MTSYLPDRSPTGKALARLVLTDACGIRYVRRDDGSQMLVPLAEKTYPSEEAAILAARRRWKCLNR